MTSKFNFSQVLKNKKIWAATGIIIAVAAVADTVGTEFGGSYDAGYGYPQGQVSYPTGGNYGSPGYTPNMQMPNMQMPQGGGAYMPPMQPTIQQPAYNPQQQMDNWRQNQLRQEQSNQRFIDAMRQ